MSLAKIENYISFTEDQHKRMQIEMERQYGIQYLIPVKCDIRKIGNSTGVVIPKIILDYLGFTVGDRVNIYVTSRDEDEEDE